MRERERERDRERERERERERDGRVEGAQNAWEMSYKEKTKKSYILRKEHIKHYNDSHGSRYS